MKARIPVPVQIIIGLVVGNVMGKGMEIVAEKAKKAAREKEKGARN